MRYNEFNQPICTTSDEVWSAIDLTNVLDTGDVYAREISKTGNESPDAPEMMEVVGNDDEGETVCWIEAPTFAACRAIADEVGIECQE